MVPSFSKVFKSKPSYWMPRDTKIHHHRSLFVFFVGRPSTGMNTSGWYVRWSQVGISFFFPKREGLPSNGGGSF